MQGLDRKTEETKNNGKPEKPIPLQQGLPILSFTRACGAFIKLLRFLLAFSQQKTQQFNQKEASLLAYREKWEKPIPLQ